MEEAREVNANGLGIRENGKIEMDITGRENIARGLL